MRSLFIRVATTAGIIALAVGCSKVTTPDAKIIEVNEGAATITAVKGEERVTYDVAPEANITLDDQPAELQELSAGDRMDVELQERGGLSVAMRIEATSQEKIPVDEPADDASPSPVPFY